MRSEPPPPFDYGARPERLSSRRLQTAPARALGGAGLTLALLALVLGVRPLFICGCALICLRVAVASWVRVAARGVRVERRLPERRVIEGEVLEAVIEVHGRYSQLTGAVIEDSVSGRRLALTGGGWVRSAPAVREQRVLTRAARRGRHRYEAPVIVVEDPFGLARLRTQQTREPDEVLVVPRTEPVHWTARGLQTVGGDPEHAFSVFGAGEVDGVRDYQPGTPATRIYWQSLARGGELLERRLIGAAETRPTVMLDCRGDDDEEGREQLDAAVRAVASLARAFAKRGGCSALLPGVKAPFVVGHNPRAWESLLAQLADARLVPRERRAPMIRADALHGPLLYVSSAPVALPGVVLRNPYPVIHVLPLAHAAYETQPVLKVCGCGGYALRHGADRSAAAA